MFKVFDSEKVIFTVENEKDSNTRYNVKNKDGKSVIGFSVDPTDNRIIASTFNFGDLKESEQQESVRIFSDYLEKNLGAKQFVIVDSKYEKYFTDCKFGHPNDDDKSKRVRLTSTKKLSEIETFDFSSLKFISGDEVKNNLKEEEILELMKTSGFLKSKIEQYELQRTDGLNLMGHYSILFVIQDKNRKIVGFCRLTKIDENTFYLSDTFVDEKCFETKEAGTAFLYQKIGNHFENKKINILLIAPPNREDEFDKQYGCETPPKGNSSIILTKFGSPGLGLTEIFEKEVDRLKNKKNFEIKL